MIDLIVELERVRRSVGRGTSPAGTGHVVEFRRTYDSPVEDVWDACTHPARIGRWFLPVSGDLGLGGSYQLEGNAGGDIIECEPPRRMAVTWVFAADASLVSIDLTPTGQGGTELLLQHIVNENATGPPMARRCRRRLGTRPARSGPLSPDRRVGVRPRRLRDQSGGRVFPAPQRTGVGPGACGVRCAAGNGRRGRGSNERLLRTRPRERPPVMPGDRRNRIALRRRSGGPTRYGHRGRR